MTNSTKSAVTVLREALTTVLDEGLPVGPGYVAIEADARAVLVATEHAAIQTTGEAVAWLYEWPTGHEIFFGKEPMDVSSEFYADFIPPSAIATPLGRLAAHQEAKAEQAGYVATAADWSEDFAHENGNYENRCSDCGIGFMGHKRRTICKVCAGQNTLSDDDTTKLLNNLARFDGKGGMKSVNEFVVRAADILCKPAAPVAPAQAVTDEQLIGVLHSLGIDTTLSVYGFDGLQVSGTNVQGVREILMRSIASIASGEWPAPLYDFDSEGKVVYRAILAKRAGSAT